MFIQIPELSKQFNLKKEDLFVDVGGYIGDFTKHIFMNFACNCLVFEPYYDDVIKRFIGISKITVLKCGLGNKTEYRDIYEHREGTSLFPDWHNVKEYSGKVLILDAKILNDLDIKGIKLNCEGSEYDILETIDLKIPQILIQFHKIKEERYNKVVELLNTTHSQKKFGGNWEMWIKK